MRFLTAGLTVDVLVAAGIVVLVSACSIDRQLERTTETNQRVADSRMLCPCQQTSGGIVCVEWNLQLHAKHGVPALVPQRGVAAVIRTMAEGLPRLRFRIENHSVSRDGTEAETLAALREQTAVRWMQDEGIDASRIEIGQRQSHATSLFDSWVEIVPVGDVMARRSTDGRVRMEEHFREVAAPLICPLS